MSRPGARYQHLPVTEWTFGAVAALACGAWLFHRASNVARKRELLLAAPSKSAGEVSDMVHTGEAAGCVRVQGTVARLHEVARSADANVDDRVVVLDKRIFREVEERQQLLPGDAPELQPSAMQPQWKLSSQEVYSQQVRTEFLLQDASGEVIVQPGGAELEIHATETAASEADVRPALLRAGVLPRTPVAARVLGYTVRQATLSLGDRVAVIGEAATVQGRPALCKPKDKTLPFIIIAADSPEELQRREAREAVHMRVLGGALLALGAVLLVWDVRRGGSLRRHQ